MKNKFKVDVKQDHLAKVSSGKPLQCLCELIWNSLDADATLVEVRIENGELNEPIIVIEDNGSGFELEKAKSLFSPLGGSWKKSEKFSKTEKRRLHGAEGKGRFKAFTLGRVVEWTINYKDKKTIKSFTIEGKSDAIEFFSISNVTTSTKNESGVRVKISELHKNFQLLDLERTFHDLAPIFALYIADYPKVSILINGNRIDPLKFIKNRTDYDLGNFNTKEGLFSAKVEIIEWNDLQTKQIHLCSKNGFPLYEFDKISKGYGEFSFSAYINSELFEKLEKKDQLNLAQLNEDVLKIFNTAELKIKKHFREIELHLSEDIISRWKAEEIYPFKEEPVDEIDKAERQVFDIIALNVAENIPDFEKTDRSTKAFQFRILKQSIEKSPQELQEIISELLKLPAKKQIELADLLQEVSLEAIINSSKVIADRLKFIAGLEEIIYHPHLQKKTKERSQLHKLISSNTWIFGDAFSLTVNDQSLTEVLKKHLALLGKNIVIDDGVATLDKKKGIVDIMLSKAVPQNHVNELEHLIIELKAPKVKINKENISQIESYAFAVCKDERFKNLKTKWNFWIISTDLDEFAIMKRNQQGFEKGIIFKSDLSIEFDLTIWVKTWSEIFAECKHRLEFIKQHLNINITLDQGFQFLKKTYPDYTKDLNK